jgi:AraC family transcriptional regulator
MSVLHIKNMVCGRCIRVVNEELEKLGLHIRHIELGKVEVADGLTSEQVEKIRSLLQSSGFELLDDKKEKIIDQIKTLVINRVHYTPEKQEAMNFSQSLEREIGMDYSYLSTLFSSVEGITIEKYMINQRIELVKELLVYDELSLSEIAYKLGYSSVAHLSSQFKKVTGLTPSHFKEVREEKRKPLDKI